MSVDLGDEAIAATRYRHNVAMLCSSFAERPPERGDSLSKIVLFDDRVGHSTIYVLRSKSEHPVVAAHRDILHKIGVTGGKIETRIANAKLDPTFLMADVEVIATYELFNISRIKLENVIHRVFDPAQLDIEIKDRFGNPIKPREWFLVPLFVVNEVVERIKDGSITQYIYDPLAARLVKAKS